MLNLMITSLANLIKNKKLTCKQNKNNYKYLILIVSNYIIIDLFDKS